ncbi:MAG: hypothetical protein ABIO02_05100 [Patescibacteria group bacterium]
MKKSRPILTFLKSHFVLVLFSVLFIILRLPSLFEPHWYGDEGIYASVALALEHGKRLYIDVFDNRLPFIYYLYSLADTNNRLLVMKIFSVIAGVITLVGISSLAKRLQLQAVIIAVLLVATWFLGTPRFEGNIANTENFFLPFAVWGLWAGISGTKKGSLVAGMLFGAAFLIKFLPMFTLAALVSYIVLNIAYKKGLKLQNCFLLAIGFSIPVILTFGFLYLNGNLKEAVQYGLLNNANYVAEYSNVGISAATKIIGFIVAIVIVIALYFYKRISNTALFLLLLLAFDYYAVLFSGRKYEHYLLQIVPSISLASGFVINSLIQKGKIQTKILLLVGSVIIVYLGNMIFYAGTGTAVKMRISRYYHEFVMATLKTHYDPSLPFTFYREPARLKIVDYIVKRYNTKNIYFYSDESWIYDYAHIDPPTFFVAVYHENLVPNGPKRTVDDLKKNHPPVIAVDKRSTMSKEMSSYLETIYTEDFEDSYFKYFVVENSQEDER